MAPDTEGEGDHWNGKKESESITEDEHVRTTFYSRSARKMRVHDI
jgi:hypothetical protein